MALVNRISVTKNGAMVFTGNTLGLSNNNLDVGAFITSNLASQVPGFPPGTTTLWQDNSSSAQLNIPATATVLYAELQWGGTASDLDGSNVFPFIDNPVTFTTPAGSTNVVSDPITAQQLNIGPVYYSRSQDVTDLVKAAGNGTYTVSGVPATITGLNSAVGWTLGIIYEDPNLPLQNMTLFSGIEGVRSAAPPADFPVSGFITPPTGNVSARLLVAAMEGDLGLSGDQALFGPDANDLVVLSGPNNSATNFFHSAINYADSESPNVGQLDTTGTFGTLNLPTLPARYGWDITNVGSQNLNNNETSALFRLTTSGDGYTVPLVGIQVDAYAPVVEINKLADKDEIILGEKIKYRLEINNNGMLSSDNLTILDYVPPGTKLDLNSINVIGATGPIVDYSIESALNIEVGPLDINQIVVIEYEVFTDENTTVPIENNGEVFYTYTSGNVTESGSAMSNLVVTNVVPSLIDGVVWYDLNCDGIRDVGEPLAEGVTVQLFDINNPDKPVNTTTTDAIGAFQFVNELAGNYYIKVISPNGYGFTLWNAGNNDSIDSDVDPTNGQTVSFVLNASTTPITRDAGLCRLNKITGQAFYDCNGDGILNNNEPFLCGVIIMLLDENGVEIDNTVTDCNGYYEFKGLSAGDYTVHVIAPPGTSYVTPVPGDYYGSKPDETTGEFSVTLTNSDYLQGFAGFRGDLSMDMKYCIECDPCCKKYNC